MMFFSKFANYFLQGALLNGVQDDGTLTQASIDIMNQRFSLELSYPCLKISRSLLYHPNLCVRFRVLVCNALKISRKCKALTEICNAHRDRTGNFEFPAFFALFSFFFS